MKNIVIILIMLPLFTLAQFENRTHALAGGNLKLSTDGYELYDDFIVGAETILGFRLGKIFVGAGTGLEYTGSNRFAIGDSLTNDYELKKFDNFDIPIFVDFTYGKRFYFEAKLGYSVKINNLKDYFTINTNTLFNSLGFGYSIPLGKSAYLDLAAEGRFNYLFTNSITTSTKHLAIYFSPVAKIGFRFAKKI
ncbi:MAG: hypothetical protein ACPGR5_00650 [Chitinophagales bacterium]